MKIVKVSPGSAELSNLFLRQTPGRCGIWQDCQFILNQPVAKCDWWVVCHFSALKQKETTVCDPNHVIYISMEPQELFVKEKFLKQFSKLMLCDRCIRHPDIIYRNGLTWWAGMKVRHENGHHFDPVGAIDYDGFKAMPIPCKTKLFSVICSNNSNLPGHQKRLAFLEKLRNHPLGSHIDLFGGGFNPIEDKLEAILPYKYSIALENSIITDYWSEKLADCYLGFALPVYYGCPNIDDYFSNQALVKIDIEKFDQTIKILEYLVKCDPYQNHVDAIIEARNNVLDQYNIFQLMADICDSPAEKYAKCTLEPPAIFKRSWPRRMVRKLIYRLRGIEEVM